MPGLLVIGPFAATLALGLAKPGRVQEGAWTTPDAAAMLAVGAVHVSRSSRGL